MAVTLASIRSGCLFMSNVLQVELECSVKKYMTTLLIYFNKAVFYRQVCIILTTIFLIIVICYGVASTEKCE
jgi:hypothetical protein